MAEYLNRRKVAALVCKITCGSDRGLCVSTPENCCQRNMEAMFAIPADDVAPVANVELADAPLDGDAVLRTQVIEGIPTNELRELMIAYRAGRVIIKPERLASTCGTCRLFSPNPGRCGGRCTEPGRVAKGKNLTKYWTTPSCKKYVPRGGSDIG